MKKILLITLLVSLACALDVPLTSNQLKKVEQELKKDITDYTEFGFSNIEKEEYYKLDVFMEKALAKNKLSEFEKKAFMRLDVLGDKLLKAIRAKKSLNAKDRVLFRFIKNSPEKIKLIKKVIMAGADVNAKDDVNQTPLLYASYYNKEAITEILLKAGASPLEKNGEDKTPTLTYVAEQGHKNILNLFLKYGLDRKKLIKAMKEAISQKKKTLSQKKKTLSQKKKTLSQMEVALNLIEIRIKLDEISALVQSSNSKISKQKNLFKQKQQEIKQKQQEIKQKQQEIKQKQQEIRKLQNAYCAERELKNDDVCRPLK